MKRPGGFAPWVTQRCARSIQAVDRARSRLSAPGPTADIALRVRLPCAPTKTVSSAYFLRKMGSDRVIDLAHVLFAHAVAVHDEPRHRCRNFLHVVGRQLDALRTKVFEQVRFVPRAGDRNNVRALRQQPCQRDLRRRRALLSRRSLSAIQ